MREFRKNDDRAGLTQQPSSDPCCLRQRDWVTGAAMLRSDSRQGNGTRPLVLPTVVVFPAEVDVTSSAAIGEELLGAFRPGVSVVIADMTATEYCDSSAIRWLIIANNQAACTGAELRLAIPSYAVLRVLHTVGADQILRLFQDVASAQAGAPYGAQPDETDSALKPPAAHRTPAAGDGR